MRACKVSLVCPFVSLNADELRLSCETAFEKQALAPIWPSTSGGARWDGQCSLSRVYRLLYPASQVRARGGLEVKVQSDTHAS